MSSSLSHQKLETMETEQLESQKHLRNTRKKSRCRIIMISVCLLFVLLVTLILILAFTVFKTRTPKTKVISTSLEGISPRVGFPAVSIELNITVNLEIHVSNPNHASFKHGEGRSVILYRDKQVGNVIIAPGKIPSMGGETIMCRLTLEADKFVGSDLSGFIKDVLGGDIAVDTKTKIPGRVNFLGIFKRDAVATSDCHIVIGVPDMKIKWQECSQKTKL